MQLYLPQGDAVLHCTHAIELVTKLAMMAKKVNYVNISPGRWGPPLRASPWRAMPTVLILLSCLCSCSIRFAVARAKEGIIDFVRGSELKVAKGKRGHLLVVSHHVSDVMCADCRERRIFFLFFLLNIPNTAASWLCLICFHCADCSSDQQHMKKQKTATRHTVIPLSWAGGLRLRSYLFSFVGSRIIPQAHTAYSTKGSIDSSTSPL